MKRQPTEAQKQAAKERRARFQTLWKQVAAMLEPERVQLSNKLGLRTCEGHELSLANQILCALQLPGVSVVGGFRQWIKMGRAVMKGQHGAMIWVPCMKPGNGNGEAAAGASPEATESAETAERRFIIGTVFDISQTQEIETATPAPAIEPQCELVAA